MSKSIFGWPVTGVAAAAVLTFGSGPSAAFTPSAMLSGAALAGDTVLVAQQRKGKGKSKQSKVKISPEHQQQIRQNVPQEYHQYIPGLTPQR
jgi:hypothetical protein